MPPKKQKSNCGRFNVGQYMSALSQKRIEAVNSNKKILALNEESKKLQIEKDKLQKTLETLKPSNEQFIIKILQHRTTQTPVQTDSNNKNGSENVWSMSDTVARNRKSEPTNETLSKRSRERRRAETLTVSSLIHGVTDKSASGISPAINDMWDTITSTCSSAEVANLMKKAKVSIKNEVHNTLHNDWAEKCEESEQNILRSVNLYYSHDVMGKRKYISIRKETSNSKFDGKRIPNYSTYNSLMKYIKSVDIGRLYDVRDTFCGGIPEDEKGDGKFRRLTEFLPRLAQFYLKVNEERVEKLKEFELFPKINPDAFLFLVAFGGDGAPCKEGTATSFLCSFLNIGERLASSSENFLTFGANVKENGLVVQKYVQATLKELTEIESKTYTIEVNGSQRLVEFKLAELPNDMKMLAFLAGELSNAATYFSTFANVNQKDSNDISKFICENDMKQWQPFTYQKRISDASKVDKKRKEIEASKLQPATKRQKLTQYISSIKSRQEFEPLLGKAVEQAKPEPLHLKNNSVCEQFMKLLKLSLSQSKISPNLKAYSDLQETLLFVKFVEFLRQPMTLKYLSNKIKSWFTETKREKDFEFRFRGKESLKYCQNFPALIKLIADEVSNHDILKKLHEVFFISVELRATISLSARIENIDANDLACLKEHSFNVYKACALTQPRVSPSIWTMGVAVPFYANKTYQDYGFGLGCNTMEGREQKHQCISKYSENSTFQNRWDYIFMHEFMQLIHLRENGHDKKRYHKTKSRYIPIFGADQCHNCGLKKTDPECEFCDSDFLVDLKRKISGK